MPYGTDSRPVFFLAFLKSWAEKTAMPRRDKNTFLTGQNAAFIAELYARYLDDPQSVDASWRGFFAELGEEPKAFLREMEGPAWGDRRGQTSIKAMAPRPTATRR